MLKTLGKVLNIYLKTCNIDFTYVLCIFYWDNININCKVICLYYPAMNQPKSKHIF